VFSAAHSRNPNDKDPSMMPDIDFQSRGATSPRVLRYGMAAIAIAAVLSFGAPSTARAQSSEAAPALTNLGGGDLLDADMVPDASPDDPAGVSTGTQVSPSQSSSTATDDQATLQLAPQVAAPLSALVAPSFTGFNGITANTQARANAGVDREPAGPSVAMANNRIFEIVNNGWGVFTTAGTTISGGVASNSFLFRTAALGATSVTLNDPRVIYDADTNKFIAAETGVVVNADSTVSTKIFFAVIDASSTRLTFQAYSIDTTNAVNSADCPCSADFVQIGSDANGLFFTANLDGVANPNKHHGAVIYGLDKRRVSSSTPVALPPVAMVKVPVNRFIAPTVTAPQSAPVVANGGTEYFVDSPDGLLGFTLRLFALTNTQSLTTATPALTLNKRDLLSELFVHPPRAFQPDVVGPLGQSLGVAHAPRLETGASRITGPVMLSQGTLWATLATAVLDAEFHVNAGAAFFGINPGTTSLSQASVTTHGYVAAPTVDTSLLYPSIAMNSVGKGAISFSLSGKDTQNPSAAFVPLASDGTLGPVTISAPGFATEDGFSAYPPNTGNTAQWGPYSGAVVDPGNGSVWMVSEYIPNLPRRTNTNWGTFVTRYLP
jgi:hypothetical protein